MNKKLLSLFGLKWNPFSPDVPADALLVAPRIDSFCWRVEQLIEGLDCSDRIAHERMIGVCFSARVPRWS